MSKELFAQVEQVVAETTGWCTVEKANDLVSTILAIRAKLVVEIGVWGGRSLLPMALALKETGGTIIGIDPWSPAASVEKMEEANVKWWGAVDHEAVYQVLKTKIAALELDRVAELWRMKSRDVQVGRFYVTNPAGSFIDLLHVDGNHSDEAVADVEKFAPLVRVGGFVFMDDIHWSGGGPARGVQKLESNGFVKLYERVNPKTGENGAMFQRLSFGV